MRDDKGRGGRVFVECVTVGQSDEKEVERGMGGAGGMRGEEQG